MSLFNPCLVLSDLEPCQCENCKKSREEKAKEKKMKDALRVDALTGFFIAVVLRDKPSRGELAELLNGVRLLRNRLHSEDYRELSKRARNIVNIEVKWRERRDWEREMATMWGASLS